MTDQPVHAWGCALSTRGGVCDCTPARDFARRLSYAELVARLGEGHYPDDEADQEPR